MHYPRIDEKVMRSYPRSKREIQAKVEDKPATDGPADLLYRLRWRDWWNQFKGESFAFKMICLYLFVEYVRPQSLFPALAGSPLAQITIGLAILALPFEKGIKLTWDFTTTMLLLFLVVIVLSCAFATYPEISWARLNEVYIWVVVYLLITNLVTTERRLLIILAIFLIASFKLSFGGARVWAMRGFSFTSWGLQGPPGFFTNSGEFSIQMLAYGPLALSLALFLRPYISRLKFRIMLLMPITAAMVVIGASSRGSQLGLAYQLYPSILKGRMSFRNIVLSVLVVFVGFNLLPAEQKARFSKAGDDQSSQQRLLYWQRGIEMIKSHPALGVGYYNFPRYFQNYYPQDMMYEGAQLPHNIFIQVGTDAGFLGLGAFLALIARTAFLARRIRLRVQRDGLQRYSYLAISQGLLTGMWGFVIAGQFVTVTYYPFFWINLAFMASLSNIVSKAERS